MMEPADRPMGFTEREQLFDACERFLAEAAAQRTQPRRPIRRTHCPDCRHELGRQFRARRGAVLACPRCGWEESPF
jgi:predicted RNA-binding Zn-ribbon protein involved in translation (DUF1610 family)